MNESIDHGDHLKQFGETSHNASPTYRGFRLQALYVLDRILGADHTQGSAFQPEGKDDLAVFDNGGRLQEIVQVKAHSDNLTFSDLKTKGGDSFLLRALKELREDPSRSIVIVSFGPVGEELRKWFGESPLAGLTLQRKLSTVRNSPVTDDELDLLTRQTRIVIVNEEEIALRVHQRLGEMIVGTDAKQSFDALMYWIYESSESRTMVTGEDLIERLNANGRFLSETRAHHAEWFTSIHPIEDIPLLPDRVQELAMEYYQGASARYTHIIADLDVVRPRQLARLSEAFHKSRIVVVHGASGQGKSTLAYRYLHDNVPSLWRFEVSPMAGLEHALSVATALSSHARAMKIPVVVYVDVPIAATGWQDLIRRLSSETNIRVLVTIREEEWRRANIGLYEFPFETVDLTLTESEAQEVYNQLFARKPSDVHPSFASAWLRFGGEGPLLEFVHLVVQQKSLRDRLDQQVNRLRDEVRERRVDREELHLLALVAVASAYGARLRLDALVRHLHLPDMQRTVQRFEKEYMLRVDESAGMVDGLHPIRSAVLVSLLTDASIQPWIALAQECLSLMPEEDLESFLLFAFSRRKGDTHALVQTLHDFEVETWMGAAGVVTALLWLGIREFMECNEAVIEEANSLNPGGWWLLLHLDLTGLVADAMRSLSTLLGPKADGMFSAAKSLQSKQTDPMEVLTYASKWLARGNHPLPIPMSDRDWRAAGTVMFWIGYLKVESSIASTARDIAIADIAQQLDIDTLADVVVGMNQMGLISESAYETVIADAYLSSYNVLKVAFDRNEVTSHFMVDLASDNEQAASKKTDMWGQTRRQLIRVRKLFPERETHSTIGYGHRIAGLDIKIDETERHVNRKNQPLDELVRINSTIRRYIDLRWRLDTWPSYAAAIMDVRREIVAVGITLQNGLESHLQGPSAVNLLNGFVSEVQLRRLVAKLSNPPELPRAALDEWGYVNEGKPSDSVGSGSPLTEPISAAMAQFMGLRSTMKEVMTALENFFNHSLHVMVANFIYDKVERAEEERAVITQRLEANGIRTDLHRLSIGVLHQTVQLYPSFQSEFRQLCGQYVDQQELTGLEREEEQLLNTLWPMWYAFATTPEVTLVNARADCRSEEDSITASIESRLRTASSSDSKYLIQVFGENAEWEGKRALWIGVDIDSPFDLNNAAGYALEVAKSVLQERSDRERTQLSVDLRWKVLAIVPTVRGRSLDGKAWGIPWFVVLDEVGTYSDSWWYALRKPIPPQVSADFEIQRWRLPRLRTSEGLLGGLGKLWLHLGSLADLQRLPLQDNDPAEKLEQVIRSRLENFSEYTNAIAIAVKEMFDTYKELSVEERERRPHLLSAVRLLSHSLDQWLPESLLEKNRPLSFDEIVSWSQQLSSGMNSADEVVNYWISDVLDEESNVNRMR